MTDIEILKEKILPCIINTEWGNVLDRVIKVLEEEPKGHWIHFPEYGTMRCSCCRIVYGETLFPRSYCPNCGAKMEEVKDD